jgi:hypothetical protein
MQKRPVQIAKKAHYQILMPKFSSEVKELFAAHIIDHAAKAKDRKWYQWVCDMLNKYDSLFDDAESLRQQLLKTHANRPAFIEELRWLRLK